MKLISSADLDALLARAAASPRARAHLNVHVSAADPVQRFFVAANRDSYFRPHRHLTRAELALVVRGRFDVLTFDDRGQVTARHSTGADTPNIAYEMPRAAWHTLFACTDGSVFLEIKQGPYDPASAAQFAPWSPAEGTPAAAGFLEWARSARPGDVAPGAASG